MRSDPGISTLSRAAFVRSLTGLREDAFAKTFIAKADMLEAWNKGWAIFSEDKVASAIITTYSKRLPRIANLQLIHTFYPYRGLGYGRRLCKDSVFWAYQDGCEYFRVSAEPEAVDFYKACGFKFIGRQKSGCQLSMFKLTSPEIEENVPILDSVIEKAIYSKRKGGCLEIFL